MVICGYFNSEVVMIMRSNGIDALTKVLTATMKAEIYEQSVPPQPKKVQ